MKVNTRKISLPKLSTRAAVQTVDTEKRTVEVVFSSGAQVKRNTYFGFGEDFLEELEISKKAIRMDRMKSGAPVLKDHRASVDSMIGVVESVKIVDKQLVGTVRFSERPEADVIFKDVQSGVIRNVSIGYLVHKYREIKPVDDGLKILRAVDWEPAELSFVAVPADPSAQVRSADEKFDCEIILERKEVSMDKTELNAPILDQRSPVVPPVDVEALKREAIEAERKRASDIREAVAYGKLDGAVADDMISRGITVDEARAEVLKKLSERDSSKKTSTVQAGENNSFVNAKRGIENALLCRLSTKQTLSDEGKLFRNVRLLDMARDLLEARGENTRHLSAMELAGRALHSTSDFPEILANVANKSLRDAYLESPQTFRPFVRQTTVSDFKEISRVQLGDAPKLLEKLENGEYQHGTIGESAEKYSVKEYGRIVAIGRRVLVNDDLGAFGRLVEMFGRQAANLESDLVWGVINANAAMADGFALFSSQHSNLAGAGAAPSVTTLGAGREAMRLQTSLDGSKLNVRPSWLVVPAALETVADQLVASISPDVASGVNPFGANGRTPLMAVAEPRLDDASSTAWYLFSDTAAIDMLEMAMLTGEEGPVIDSMIDFDTDGMKLKARHTVGVKAIDWRGVYKNPG